MSLQNTQNLITDLCRDNSPSVIVKQYEKNSRYILVKCTENGSFVPLDNKAMQCNIKMLTPDNRAIYNTCTIQDDGTVLVALTESMVYAAGDAVAELNIVDLDAAALLATMTFHVIIKPSAYTDDTMIATDEFGALTEVITETKNMLGVVVELENRINEEQIEWNANEELRQTSEEARAAAENDRAEAENTRIANEQTRISNENARAAAELLREQNEAKRQANESLREQNETARAEAEAQRETSTAASIGNANAAADNANAAASNANEAAERASAITAVETMTNETPGIARPDNDTISVSDGVFKANIDKELLDKLGESEAGTLTFNGQEIRTSTDFIANTKAEAQTAIDAGLVENGATIYVKEASGDSSNGAVGTANVMVGATETSDGESGMVLAPLAGQENYVLKGDGTWQPEVSFDIDDAISATSENPVQNKVVANELLKKADGIFFDEENSELQLMSGEKVLSTVAIKNSVPELLIVSVPSQNGSLTYTGLEQSPSWNNYIAETYTIGGVTCATNAGTYIATFTPNSGYAWSDGTNDTKEVNWTISKAIGSLSLSETALSLDIAESAKTVTVTRSGDGMINATSSNIDVASVDISDTTITITGLTAGEATITISVGEGTNYSTPESQTISVTVCFISTTLADNTPATIQTVTRSGQAANYWSVGDSVPIKLNGTVGSLSLDDTYYAFILGFDHNSDIEGSNTIHFQFGKTESGVDIAFVDSNYYSMGTTSGFRFNTTNTNSGGWENSYMRQTICEEFFYTMPAEWQNIIVACTKYSDNVGGGTNKSSSVTSTLDRIFLLSEYEVCGIYNNSNDSERNYQQQYNYYANGNSKIKKKHLDGQTNVWWWLRSVYKKATVTTTTSTIDSSKWSLYIGANGSNAAASSHYSLGFTPCFMIA